MKSKFGVFCRANGEPFSWDHIYKKFKNLKEVGIDPKRFSWKELRHIIGRLMYRKWVQNTELNSEPFKEFLGLKENSANTVKKVVEIDALQEVSPIASA